MSILILVEHDNQEVKASTLNTVTAAGQLGDDLHALVVGFSCDQVVTTTAKIEGIDKVLKIDSAEYEYGLVENTASVVENLAKSYSHVLAPASTFGKNLMREWLQCWMFSKYRTFPRLSAKIHSFDRFMQEMHWPQFSQPDSIKLITVRTTTFDAAAEEGGDAEVEELSSSGDVGLSQFVKHDLTRSERPELTTASIVISGGRGMQSGENFNMLERIADKLGAAVGASRAAVDAGYVPNDYQVGQTGKVVAPDLYIAVGISGAIQHLAGMKDSKVIVAINKDEEAPIFQVADYGWVSDLFTAIPDWKPLLNSF